MKKAVSIMFGILLLLVFSNSGFSTEDNSWQKIYQKGEMVVGFCAQYPPFESKTRSGEFIGFDVDLGKAVAREMGVTAVFKDGEWQGLIAGMNKGDYDILITCMSKSSARKKNANFSDKYFDLNEVIIVRKDEVRINSLEDLKDKIVGVQMTTSSEKAVDDRPGAFKEVKKYNYTTEAFLDLKFKRIDAVVCGYAYAVLQIKKDPSFKVVGAPLHSSEIVMVFPKGADALTDKVNKALADIQKNGTYKKIFDQWLALDN